MEYSSSSSGSSSGSSECSGEDEASSFSSSSSRAISTAEEDGSSEACDFGVEDSDSDDGGHSVQIPSLIPHHYDIYSDDESEDESGDEEEEEDGGGRGGEEDGGGGGEDDTFARKAAKDHRINNKKYGIVSGRVMLLTDEDILFFGLSYAGFEETRQNVRANLNIDRFKAFFGPEPRTVKDLLYDLKEKYPDIIYRDVMMTMNWLKLCK